jgi:ABC-type transporter Mla subunit MlaD
MAAALTAAAALRDELQAEVVRSREERVVLRSLDGGRIQARMEERLEFIERTEHLQRQLRVAQSGAAQALGLTDATADSIARRAPREGGQLVELLGQIRALASTLSELAALNHSLAERALGCTRAYTRAMAPRPTAYGRLGAPPPSAALAAVSRRA